MRAGVLCLAEYGIAQGRRAIRERFLVDSHRPQNTQIEVGHACFAVTPVCPMAEAHVAATSHQRRQVGGIVRGAGTTAEQDNRIVKHRPVAILAGIQTLKKMGELLAQKEVISGKMQLASFITRMGKRVVGAGQTQFEREGVADAHAIFPVQHENHRTGDIGIKGERNQDEHGAVIFRRLLFRSRIQIQVGEILFF